MNEPVSYRVTLEPVEAIRRDGTVARDLAIAGWMQGSRPYGEYQGSAGSFAIRATSGDLMPVGVTDWVLKIGTRFIPCPAELFVVLTQHEPALLCGECRDPFPPAELYPAATGQDLCADCLLELELSRQPMERPVVSHRSGPMVPERSG